jgi:hypothetical protein
VVPSRRNIGPRRIHSPRPRTLREHSAPKERRLKHSLFALIFFLVVGVRAQEPANSPASQDLLQLEKTRVNALVHDDIPALEKLFADDLTYVHSSGVLESKAEFLGRLRSGERKYLSMEHDTGAALRSYSDAAILAGSTKVAVTFRGQSQNLHLRFTETWLKRAGQWQVVAWHATKIADQ